jgi:hypothetical protein
MYAMPQANTISAKPGAVNYIEGNVSVDGQPLSAKGLKATFLNPNDTLSTDVGKAEILLTPGVFLRLGDNSQIRMVSPSLIDTQVELQRGEAMIEVDQLVKENHISIVDHGASIIIERNGLYRFTADDIPKAAVIEGKAEVYFGEEKIDLRRGHETVLSDLLKPEKFDSKKEDELYAWSNIRSEYEASASYQAARNASAGSYGALGYGGYGGYGPYSYGLGPGWYWNSGFDSWCWLPGNGAFFSPFGYGFYGPGLVGYAPVVVVSGLSGRNGWPGHHMVPVNPKNPPAVGSGSPTVGSPTVGSVVGTRNNLPSHYASPAAYQAARAQAAHSFASSGGFHTASGAAAPTFTGGGAGVGAQPAAHASWSGGGGAASSGASHAGFSGGAASSGGGGGFHGGGGGGGHTGGGGGGRSGK